MNDIAEQRPTFFEGEVLSAADLEQVLVYARDQSARHLLGGHTWGIVAGLQLLEQPTTTGGTDVYLLPGYAVDGYGRGVLVVNPLRLSVDWFNGQPTGPVRVWLRYDEADTSAVRPGFQVCCGETEAYSRVAESYAIEVGNLSLAKQQSGISVAGETVDDARTALRTFNDAGQVVCDASIPYQDLPLADETKSRWLIPIGEVNWKAGNPGTFQPLDDTSSDPTHFKVIHARRVRRYLGVVAENLYAADGLIRLRARTTDVAGTVDQDVVDQACEPGDLEDAGYQDAFEYCASGPAPTELVWIEGALRVTKDVRVLAPGRLELRDGKGTSYVSTQPGNSATFLERIDHTDPGENTADLAIVLSKPDKGHNRLLVQQVTKPKQDLPCMPVTFDPAVTRFAVLDSGEVGIGTDDPDQLLTIVNKTAKAYLHLEDAAAHTDCFLGADDNGGVLATINDGDLRFRTGGTDLADIGSDPSGADEQLRMIILASGQVGIGTDKPSTTHQLTVHDAKTASIVVNNPDHELLLRANKDGVLVAANKPDDSLVLGAGGDNEYVWITKDGFVGVNTDNPGYDLSIYAASTAAISVHTSQGVDRRLLLGVDADGVYVGSKTDHDLMLRTNDADRMIVKTTGRVGISTDDPKHALDVRGNIALGGTGQYLATGGITNWAVIAGNVSEGGVASIGAGFTCTHSSGSRDYRIDLTDAFADKGVVTIQLRWVPVDLPFPETAPIPFVHDDSGSGFTVTLRGGDFSECAFSFIAMYARPS